MKNGSSNTMWHVDYIGKNVQSWKVLNCNLSIFLLLFVVSIFPDIILKFLNFTVCSSCWFRNFHSRRKCKQTELFFHLPPNLLRLFASWSKSSIFREINVGRRSATITETEVEQRYILARRKLRAIEFEIFRENTSSD